MTSKSDRQGLRWAPDAFTELGVATLSSVPNCPRIIAVNIQIIRAFTRLRELLAENGRLRLKVEALEKKYDEQFRAVFDAIRRLLSEPPPESGEIGFKAPIDMDSGSC